VTTCLEAVVAPRHQQSILRILVMATFVVILNETIMVNAIPRLMVEFEVTKRAADCACRVGTHLGPVGGLSTAGSRGPGGVGALTQGTWR
jgi:hypothetical protein